MDAAAKPPMPSVLRRSAARDRAGRAVRTRPGAEDASLADLAAQGPDRAPHRAPLHGDLPASLEAIKQGVHHLSQPADDGAAAPVSSAATTSAAWGAGASATPSTSKGEHEDASSEEDHDGHVHALGAEHVKELDALVLARGIPGVTTFSQLVAMADAARADADQSALGERKPSAVHALASRTTALLSKGATSLKCLAPCKQVDTLSPPLVELARNTVGACCWC